MRIFMKNKLCIKLIASMCIVFALMNLGIPNTVQAAEEAAGGGKILTPVLDFIATLGDGLMNVVQNAILGTDATLSLDITGSGWGIFWAIVGAAIACVALVILTGGVGALVAGMGGIFAAIATSSAVATLTTVLIAVGTIAGMGIAYSTFNANYMPDVTVFPTFGISPEEIFEGKLLVFDVNFFNPKEIKVAVATVDSDGSALVDNKGDVIISKRMSIKEWDKTNDTGGYINRGANEEVQYYYYLDNNNKEIKTSRQSASWELSSVISKWYTTMRTIAVVALLLVLVYVGIRMLISSVASEKSKYKEMMVDWIVAICLVFIMHYIMVFAVGFTENIVGLLRSVSEKRSYTTIINLTEMDSGKRNRFQEAVEKAGLESHYSDDKNFFVWPTNLMGYARIEAQKLDGTSQYVGFVVCYIVLVMYTLFFAITYARRVLYMAFLTIISPLVAVTYPIDKINDGKAQAFNMWLREYIFNLLIQPVHLLLYVVLISMAFELSSNNILYTLVAIGFMIPAEKLIRKMFGFEKAQTPGFLGGATGAALTMSAMQSLSKLGKGSSSRTMGAKKQDGNEDGSNKRLYSRSADSGHNLEDLYSNEPLPLREGQNQNRNNNEQEPARSNLTDEQLAARDNLQSMIDNPDTTDEDREIYQQEVDYYNGLENPTLQQQPQATQPELPQENRTTARQRLDQMKNQHKFGIKQRIKFAASEGKNAMDFIHNPQARKKIASGVANTLKTGTKLTGTAIGATIGLGAGIASGDLGNVSKNAIAGGVAGGAFGSAIGTGTVNAVSSASQGFKDGLEEIRQEKYGADYSSYQKAKADAEFVKDKEARKLFEKEFQIQEADKKKQKEAIDKLMEDAVVYRQHGVTDNNTIVKAMKLNASDRLDKDSIASAIVASKATKQNEINAYVQRLEKTVGQEKARKIGDNAQKLNKI